MICTEFSKVVGEGGWVGGAGKFRILLTELGRVHCPPFHAPLQRLIFCFYSNIFLIQALHENIQSKQEDTVSVVQDTESLLRQYPDRIDQVLQSQLRGQATDLKSRYGVVSYQSQNRTNRLNGAVDELEKFSEEQDEFVQWLNGAEKKQADLVRDTPRDMEALKGLYGEQKQFAEDVVNHAVDLKFLNTTGPKFLDRSKVQTLF